VFRVIKNVGRITNAEMLQTFNMGVGLVVVAGKENAEPIIGHLAEHEIDAYVIGEVVEGAKNIHVSGEFAW
jgi:phosphoribosylformylglycinamidine cyclo-ligase